MVKSAGLDKGFFALVYEKPLASGTEKQPKEHARPSYPLALFTLSVALTIVFGELANFHFAWSNAFDYLGTATTLSALGSLFWMYREGVENNRINGTLIVAIAFMAISILIGEISGGYRHLENSANPLTLLAGLTGAIAACTAFYSAKLALFPNREAPPQLPKEYEGILAKAPPKKEPKREERAPLPPPPQPEATTSPETGVTEMKPTEEDCGPELTIDGEPKGTPSNLPAVSAELP